MNSKFEVLADVALRLYREGEGLRSVTDCVFSAFHHAGDSRPNISSVDSVCDMVRDALESEGE